MPAVLLAILAATAPAAKPGAPVSWSPDGRWVAYVLASRPAGAALRPGQLLDPRPGAERTLDRPPAGARRYRLWATRPATGESTLLAESDRALTSPAWSPDGAALAFGRVVAVAGGRAAFELVVKRSLDDEQALFRQEMGADGPEHDAALGGAALTWSPDGRHLSVPHLDPEGVAFVHAERGGLLKVIEGAEGVGWSPDAGRATFYRGGALWIVDAGFNEPKQVIEVAGRDRLPPAAWTRDGRAILVPMRGPPPGGPGFRRRMVGMRMGLERADLILVRVDVESGRLLLHGPLLHDPLLDPEALRWASFAQDAMGMQLLYTTAVRGQEHQISRAFPRQNNAVQIRINPVDPSVPLGDLALDAEAARLAFRVGPAGPASLVAILDTASLGPPARPEWAPLVPDDDARAEWIALLADTARGLLASTPPADAEGKPLGRVSSFPSPAELGASSVVAPRLRHLGALGRPLARRPGGAPTAPAGLEEALAEALLLFTYLAHDPDRPRAHYEAASEALAASQAGDPDPDRQRRLLLIGAQIALGLGETDRVEAVLDVLGSGRPAGVLEVEETPAGVVFRPLPDPTGAWLAYLGAEARAIAERPPAEPTEAPAFELELEPPLQPRPVRAFPAVAEPPVRAR